jgi:hypothetical protein
VLINYNQIAIRGICWKIYWRKVSLVYVFSVHAACLNLLCQITSSWSRKIHHIFNFRLLRHELLHSSSDRVYTRKSPVSKSMSGWKDPRALWTIATKINEYIYRKLNPGRSLYSPFPSGH